MSALISKTKAGADESRRHQRVRVRVLGRYMLADQQESACQTIDMSPGGIALIGGLRGGIGERVVCYLDHFGRLEGRLIRLFGCGFALELAVPASKRERLADQLTWHANRSALGVPEGRHHTRIVPRHTDSILRLQDGRSIAIQIIDLSSSGVAFVGIPDLEIGTPVTVGRRAGHVARVVGSTMAVEFLRLIQREELDEAIVL